MKILQVIHQFVPEHIGGAELHCYLLSKKLAAANDVMIFTRSPQRSDSKRSTYEGLTVLSLGKRDPAPGIPFWRSFDAEEGFEQTLINFNPDVIHFHHLSGLSLDLPAIAAKYWMPSVFTCHDYYLACPRGQLIRNDLAICEKTEKKICPACLEPAGLRRRWFPRFSAYGRFNRAAAGAVRNLDAFIAPSLWMFDFFGNHVAPRERLYYVEHGLDNIEILPPEPSKNMRFAYMGSLIPSKGIHLLIKAFQLLPLDRITLTLYGSFIPYHGSFDYRKELSNLADEDPRIMLHGPFSFEERAELYRGMDILVVPSIWAETYGLTVREGFQAGLEVIAADTGGLSEAFSDNQGNLFAPGSIESLAGVMREAAERLLAGGRSSRAPKPARTMDQCVKQVQHIYNKLVARTGPSRG